MRDLMMMLMMVFVSGLVPLQAIVNSRLGQVTRNPFLSAFVSFAGGVLTLGIITLIWSQGMPRVPDGARVPWYLLTGGIFGAMFVTTTLVLVPRIGVANVIAATIVGQLTMSLILDHFGLLGIPRNPMTLTRVLGATFLVLGMFFIQRQ